ncbi:hypothetical protein IKJ53_01115 [bacterium]|nr:hypothetical protein [bacterium]
MINAIKELISELEDDVAALKDTLKNNEIDILRLENSNAILRQHIEIYNDRISKLEDKLLELEK